MPETTKKDLMVLNAIHGTSIDKYLTLSGKAPIEGGKLVFNVVFEDNRGTQEPTTINVTPTTDTRADATIDVTTTGGGE